MAIAAIASIVLNKFDDLLREEPNLFNGIEVESIKAGLQLIQRYFNLSERKIKRNLIMNRQREEDIAPEIQSWIARAKELVFETEDILDSFISWKEQRRKQKYTFFIHFRNNFSNKLKRIHPKFSQHRSRYNINPPEDGDETSSFIRRKAKIDRLVRDSYWDVREAEAIGLKDDVNLLVSRLIIDDEKEEVQKDRRVISIVGMGGLGKTTLAKLVYNDSRVIEYFQIRCWIYVSQDFRVDEIVNRIWNSITGHRESSLTVEQSAARLCKFLDGKKYLFVMDDVRDAKAWLEIQKLLPDKRNGNRVLLTTREEVVASRVDTISLPHQMKFMTVRGSLTLLWRWVRLSGRREAFLTIKRKFSREIIVKCGRLPLAIKMVAGLLWMKNKNEWYNLLNRFLGLSNNTDPDFFPRMLELSYNDLPSHLKHLYLYLLFFPKEHEIPLRRIFGLWLAHGFLTGKYEEVSREELARVYLNELIVRNMIEVVKWKLDGTPKTFRVPGLLRDVLLPRATDIGFFHNQNINPDTALPGRTDMEAKIPASVPDAPATPKYVRHFVEYTDINDSLSLERFISNSRSYISFNFRIGDSPAEVTGQFLGRVIQKHSFRLLGVLDLERVYKPKLPDSLGKLHLLKYLGLRWTFLDAIPSSVGDLLNLETLDVKHTYISCLPSSIRKMKKLQHLYLNEIHLHLSVGVGDIALQNLQTLWGLTADRKNPIENNLNCLITLTKLGLTVQDTLVEVYAEWISRLTALRILRFRSRDEYGRPSDLKMGSFSSLSHLHDLYLFGKLTMENPLLELQLPESLTVLTLSVSGLEQDPMPTLEKLPNLQALRLFANSFTGKRMVCSNGGFPSLCILKLWMLVELEEWIIEEEAMSSLEQLEIRCCKKLKKCPENMLQLTMLGNLILTNMSKDFVAQVEAGSQWHVSLTLNNWEFPTFPDQESSHGGEGSG